jgi:hypothetical protein
VLASLTLVWISASIAVTTPGAPDDGCPSSRQVSDALAARLPGAAQPLGQPPGPAALRLSLGNTAAGAVRVQLADATGEPVLMRVLPPSARVKPADCVALAETVALIVDRYLHDVGYEAPPLPPPAPPPPPPARTVATQPPPPAAAAPLPASWQLAIGLQERYGDTAVLEASALLSLGHETPLRRARLGVRFGAGLGEGAIARWTDRTASFHRVPLRLAAYLAFPAGPGRIEPGLGLGVDLIDVSVQAATPVTSGQLNGGLRMAPLGDAGLGYLLPLGKTLYLRAIARGGVALPYTFVTGPPPDGVQAWSTPHTYLEFGVESGVSFP